MTLRQESSHKQAPDGSDQTRDQTFAEDPRHRDGFRRFASAHRAPIEERVPSIIRRLVRQPSRFSGEYRQRRGFGVSWRSLESRGSGDAQGCRSRIRGSRRRGARAADSPKPPRRPVRATPRAVPVGRGDVEVPALGEWRFDAAIAKSISQPVLYVFGTESGPLAHGRLPRIPRGRLDPHRLARCLGGRRAGDPRGRGTKQRRGVSFRPTSCDFRQCRG